MAMAFFFSKATRYQSGEKAERQFSLHTHPFKLVLRSPSPFPLPETPAQRLRIVTDIALNHSRYTTLSSQTLPLSL